MNSTSSYSSPTPSGTRAEEYHTVLLAINAVVLVSGTISLSLMMHILKSSSTSITSIAVLNLVFAHFIFLVTVPFRIYYYINSSWNLGPGWCKVVSAMIHVHMYMSFVFYVIILITRLLTFYRKAEQLPPFRSIHALLASTAVWVVVLIAAPLVTRFLYGNRMDGHSTEDSCFKFGQNIEKEQGGILVNCIVSTLIIVAAAVLTGLQANVLRVLYEKHRQGCISQQDFGAQLKSMCFALIMVVCFIPYHVFRIYYVHHIDDLQHINEVFLSLTTFNCLDMLTFLGRRTCYMCFFRRVVLN